jgi:hypothetical protein
MRDSRDECVCSNRLRGVTVPPGGWRPLTATFNVPDVGSKSMQIMVPGFDRLRDVDVKG